MKISFRKARGKRGSRYLVRCDDCGSRLEIYPPDFSDPTDELMEIGGVIGSVQEWRRLLFPLLDDPRWIRRMLDKRVKASSETNSISAKKFFSLLASERLEKSKLPGKGVKARRAKGK